MGQLGWSQDEVDRMDVAVCARFLGRGGGDDEYPLVIRGSRALHLPNDTEGDSDASEHVLSVQGPDRRAAYKRAANTD